MMEITKLSFNFDEEDIPNDYGDYGEEDIE